MLPPHSSLVKYESPILISSTKDKKTVPPATTKKTIPTANKKDNNGKGNSSSDVVPTLAAASTTQTEDILNSILPPKYVPIAPTKDSIVKWFLSYDKCPWCFIYIYSLYELKKPKWFYPVYGIKTPFAVQRLPGIIRYLLWNAFEFFLYCMEDSPNWIKWNGFANTFILGHWEQEGLALFSSIMAYVNGMYQIQRVTRRYLSSMKMPYDPTAP